LSPVWSFRSFKFHARVQASLLSPCAWSPRSVLAVALPGSAARLATPWWAWLALAGLRHRYRCTAGPPCLGAAVAVVPHRAALASPSRRRLAGGCPGVAGTAPCGLGGQRASASCRVWGNSPSLLYRLNQLPLPELGDLAVPLCFFLLPSPPWTRFRAPPCLLHLTSIRCWRRVAATWSTSSTLLLSFWSHGSLQLEC
jgi:hypothetical protein